MCLYICFIYPYSPGLFYWHFGNTLCPLTHPFESQCRWNYPSHIEAQTKWPPFSSGQWLSHLYRGWLHVFVPVRTPPHAPPQTFVHARTSKQLLQTSLIFGRVNDPDLQITWLYFGRFSSWPWPWIFKVIYRICFIAGKNGPIATKQKAKISIELYAPNVTIGFDLGHDLDLEFSRSNMEFAKTQPKMNRLPRNEKQTYRLNSRPRMCPSDLILAMTLTLNFQGQIWKFLYLSQKWSDCHETKSKHSVCILGLKCNHEIWPWPWRWP